MFAKFSGVESERAVSKLQKEKENFCVVYSIKRSRETRKFHVAVLQRRLRDVQKSVMHVQSCCFANIKPTTFLSFSLPSTSSLLKFRNIPAMETWRHTSPLYCLETFLFVPSSLWCCWGITLSSAHSFLKLNCTPGLGIKALLWTFAFCGVGNEQI